MKLVLMIIKYTVILTVILCDGVFESHENIDDISACS